MKKAKILLPCLAAVATVAVIAGGVFAFRRSETKADQHLSTGQFTIGIQQQGAADAHKQADGSITFTRTGVPGDSWQDQITVRNTGDYTAYVRVLVHKNWVAHNGEKDVDKDPTLISLDIGGSEGWLPLADPRDAEYVEYYYTRPLAPGAATTVLADKLHIAPGRESQVGNSYTDSQFRFAARADGVQAVAAQDAMLAAWGVQARFRADGTLAAVTLE